MRPLALFLGLAVVCLGVPVEAQERGSANRDDAPPADSPAADPVPADGTPDAEPQPQPVPGPVPQGGTGFPLTLGALPAGKSLTIRFRATVNNPFVGDAQQVSNQGTVSGGNFSDVVTDDPDTGAPNDPTLTPIDLRPDLALTKSDGNASVAPGGTVAYTLGYSNLSAFGAHGVVLTDMVPALTSFNPGASSAGWACAPNNNAGSVCTLSVGLVSGGASGSRVFAVTVVSPVPAGATQVSNTASIASNRPDPVPGNNSASDTTPIDAAPDLTLGKSDGGASVAPGGTVAYTLSYQNVGNQGATGVVLTDVVPANTTFNAGASTAGWACAPNNNAGSTCTLAVGTLNAAASGSATYAVTVVNPVPAGVAQVSNTASVADDGANGPDPVPANNTATDTTPVNAAPDLTLGKSDGGASVTPGGTVAYTLSYQNVGNQGATGVVLTDVVPANTTFNAGASTAGWTCAPNNNPGSTCTLAVGALNAAASGSATYTVTVVNPVAAGVAQISNTASVADDGANGVDPTPANNTATDTTPVNAQPDLSIVKDDGGASVTPGGTVSYTLSYQNVGNQGATGVVLTDVVPANTTFNAGASTAGWTCVPNNNAGSSCTLAVGALAGGASGSATYAVTVAASVPAGVTQITNTASVADDGTNGADPVPGNNSASDTTPIVAAPDLTLGKSDGGASVAPGGTVAYTLSYQNAGNQGATGVVLTDVVPANTTFNAGASTAGWVCAPNGNPGSTCTLAVGAVNVGASGSATYAVTVVNPVAAGVAQVSNTASVADDGANGADPTPANNTATDTTPVNAAPDLTLGKSDGGASVAPGGTVSYTLSYQNVGNQGATGVVLTDVVPANTTFNGGASTAGWVCAPNNNAGSTCTLAVGAVNAAASGSATYAVTVVNPVAAGVAQVSNTASVADDGANGPDPTPANNTATDTTPVNAAPDLSVVKDDGGASVTPGGTVSYTLSYQNVGNQGATGVVLTDVVPANTTFNAGASTAGWACVPNNNAGSSCTLAVGAVNAAGSGSATYAVTVVDPVPGGVTQVSNTASVADDGTNGADPNPANNSESETTPIVAAPEMSIAKSDGGAAVAPGGTVAYTLSYANGGNRGATGVVLRETVPANTTFNPGASTAGWTCVPGNNAGSACSLAVGAVAVGANGSATYAVTLVSPAPAGLDQVSNTAQVEDDGANGTDPNPANNTSTDTTPVAAAPDLLVTKTDSGATSVAPGGNLLYALQVANVGNQDATGIVLTETVPVATTFNPGASTAGWACVPDNNAGSTCTLAVGALAAGSNTGAAFGVVVADPVAAGLTQIANTASGADDGSNGADPNPGDNTATETTPLDAAPDLALTKSDGGASATLGGGIAYTLTYSNGGNQGATGVTLTETVPADTTFDAAGSTAGWVCAPDTNPSSTCTLAVPGTLAGGGASGSATFAVTVASTVPAGVLEISNTASVTDDGANGTDPDPSDNTASDQTPLVLVADVTTAELTHGSTLTESLAVLAGPLADTDLYRLSQKPHSSYEIVVDGTAGGVNDVILERLAADGSTVLQTSLAIGVGIGRSLRFSNETGAPVDGEFVRVRSGGCGTDCGADSRYRLRAYETTYAFERFNNASGMISVVLLQNRGDVPATGTLWFWNAAGTLVGSQPFNVAPRQLFTFQSQLVAPNTSGSITVTSDAPYDALAGKVAVLDPINGPAQDVIMKPRIR